MPVDPDKLRILTYPDPVLRQKAAPVPEVTELVRRVARRMIELMYQAEGIGLAAPQVGVPWRLFVVDVPASDGRKAHATPDAPATATSDATVYINPVLSHPSREAIPGEEGCLSLPDIRGTVLRPDRITITALDLDGATFTQTGAGLLARCWQHEHDHLDGVLILDRMTQASRMKNKVAIRNLERD